MRKIGSVASLARIPFRLDTNEIPLATFVSESKLKIVLSRVNVDPILSNQVRLETHD